MKQLDLFGKEKKNKKVVAEKTILETILNEIPYPVYPEYKFSSFRKWRADYFIDLSNGKGLICEFEGGVYTGGRHTRPIGFINDCYKYNTAVSMGIPVLRYTCKHLEDPEAIKTEILQSINSFIK
jgi:hypothetical protein